MHFDEQEEWERWQAAWNKVQIVRSVDYGLFTFGESELPYYLVCHPAKPNELVKVSRGEVRVTRPMIITPHNAPPVLSNFFEDHDDENIVSHLLARMASFRHLRLDNRSQSQQFSSDSVEEVVDRINADLDRDDEDRIAILTAPAPLAGVAVLRYATERIMRSAPDNIQELRERGFLP